MITLKSLCWPAFAWSLFAVVVWHQWPLETLMGEGAVVLCALFGVACVVGPGDDVHYGSLRGQGYSSFTASEARTLSEGSAVRLVGVLLLVACLMGWARRALEWFA